MTLVCPFFDLFRTTLLPKISGKSFSFPWDIPFARLDAIHQDDHHCRSSPLYKKGGSYECKSYEHLQRLLARVVSGKRQGFWHGCAAGLSFACGLFNRELFDIIRGVTPGTVMGTTGDYL